ncbi:iron ABC transporter permease [Serratia ureilytica]
MQTILNNPLASPFTLGVSSAAAFGAALAIVPASAFRAFPISGSSPPTPLFALFAALMLDGTALDAGRHLRRGAVRHRVGVYLQRWCR